MASRVIRANEISLNGQKYRLTRPVTVNIASNFPGKVVTGDVTSDARPNVSVIRWSNARGGIGKKDHEDAVDVERMWYSTSHLRVAGHRTLPARTTTTAASGVTGVFAIGAMAELASTIYAAFSTSIRAYTFTSDSWGSNLHTLAAVATDSLTARLGGTVYMIFAYGTGYVDTTDGSSFNNRTTDVQYMAEWDNRLWGIDATGQLRWTFSPTGTWTNDAQLPFPDDYVRDLFVAKDATGEPILYASTRVGLFAHDAANNRFVKTDMALPFHADSGSGVSVWRGDTYIPAGLGIYRYSVGGTAVVTAIGPDRDQGLPALRRGTIVRTESTHNDLIVLVDNSAAAAEEFDTFATGGMASHSPQVMDTETGISFILGYDGIGWQVLWESGSAEQAIDYSLVSNAYSGYRLWWAQNERIHYQELPVDIVNPSELSDREYADSSRDELPWFNAGQDDVNKTILRALVHVTGASSNDTVTPYYATNYDDTTWTSLAAIESDGVTTYDFPDSTTPTGTAFRSIRFRTDLINGTTKTLSPDVRSITMEYIKAPTPKSGFSVEIDLTKHMAGLSQKQQRASLLTARDSATLVEFTFRDDDGNTRNFYVKMLQLTGLEFTGYDEGGITRLTLVEP
jgi:hypothetical protein